jgi:hypothetical protein
MHAAMLIPSVGATPAAYPERMLLARRRRAGVTVVLALATFLVLSACGDGSENTESNRNAGSSPYSFVNRDRVEVSARDGGLSLTLTAPALWFNDSTGVLAFKPVTGDFTVTATVRTRKASNPAEPPAPAIRLGGLMARDPASDASQMQNYVHIVAGNGPSGVLAIENKTTVNSNSVYEAPEWPSPDAELRICRVGSTFNLYKRPVGSDTWQRSASYDRPDLPDRLQVGADIYSPNPPPDLRVRWDDLTYASGAGACESAR